MRLAVFSDVHGNLAALDAVLSDIGRRGVDMIVGLGDFLSGPFDPRGVAERLMAAGFPLVRGNHDRWVSDGREENDWAVDKLVRDLLDGEQLRWLAALPPTQVIDGAVFLCHGTPTSDSTFWMDQLTSELGVVSSSRAWIEAAAEGYDFPVLLCGHTHVQRTLRLADGRLLLNPGSVGLPFLLGSTDARYAILERRQGAWSAELHAIPYDRETPKQQARAHGHPGFARALDTGWATLAEL
ncbi:MAG TPA: metallophosphoesterase family protein [Alphaproteobacteria bacterium]|nr:metallophosphoesterase family protein [Alphaproteobacteria bacterium]